jgi:hypothetical protein
LGLEVYNIVSGKSIGKSIWKSEFWGGS